MLYEVITILEMMPTKDSLGKLMVFFGFTLSVGFVISYNFV